MDFEFTKNTWAEWKAAMQPVQRGEVRGPPSLGNGGRAPAEVWARLGRAGGAGGGTSSRSAVAACAFARRFLLEIDRFRRRSAISGVVQGRAQS